MINDLLFWLLPSGWLCSLAQFFIHRRKSSHDDLLQMVQELKAEMLNVQRENIKLYGAVRELSSILALAGGCSFYDVCPINDRLQNKPEQCANLDLFKSAERPSGSGPAHQWPLESASEPNS